MNNNPILGVLLHAVGGFAAASFYIPFRRVRGWSWESYWLAAGFSSWIIAPWVVAALTCPGVVGVLKAAPASSLGWCYGFGVLWGIGGLTFGLTMRYLGMSLGYALALGFCAAFGTVIPPVFMGSMGEIVSSASGLTTLAGVVVCLVGIGICGWAGRMKERELPEAEKKAAIGEFNFALGVWVAIFAGVMSACMAFGIAAGKPIAALALERGTASIWQNTPVFIVILAGGFTTNFIWCLFLNLRRHSLGDYYRRQTPLLGNYIFSSLAGVTWYLQFMFYGMGMTRMGRYDFSSWTIHMAFIIVFSNIWGLVFHEWRGSGRPTRRLIFAGLGVLLLSTVVVGLGNYLAALK